MISNGACGHETTSVVWGNTDRNHMVDPISNTDYKWSIYSLYIKSTWVSVNDWIVENTTLYMTEL